MAEKEEGPRSWTGILAPVLGAAVLGIAGLIIQARIAAQDTARAYVQLALEILREPAGGPGGPRAALRHWAVEVVDHYSEVKLTPEGRQALLQGELRASTPQGLQVQ